MSDLRSVGCFHSYSMAALSFTSPIRLSYFTNLPSRVNPKVASYRFTKSSFLFPGLRPLSSIAGPVTKYDGRRLSFIVSAVKKLSDTELLDVPPGTDSSTGVLPSSSGVYAVYDGNGDLQFIGISRNIASSILSHRKSLPELCSSVKVGVVDEPERATLTEAWKSWMEEHIAATGKIPPGNKSGDNTWVQKPQQPAKKKADLRLTPGPHVQLTVPMEELIDRLVKENKVVAFIKGSRYAPLCGFSQRVIGILESEGVNYESVDVLDEEHNRGLREKLKNYSSWPTFPQIYVDGELVGGCDILTSMYEKGELAALFDK